MTGVTSWSFRPYKPLMFETGDIYICRVYPGSCRIGFDWLPADGAASYAVHWRKRGSEAPYETAVTGETSYLICGLEEDTDYEFLVESGALKSRVRLAKTGTVPGDSVVNYLHPEDRVYSYSGQYLCSPSMVRHPEGYLLASMDVFKGSSPQALTLIFRSDDEGATWHYVSELYPSFWGKMFIHKGSLYMLSCSSEYGDLLIGRSDDGGVTFGMPTVLLRGSYNRDPKGVHKNPQPVISYKGRLWATLEWGSWAFGTHAAMCASIDENADLLDASNWHFTEPVPYDPAWKGTAEGNSPGCIEGCMVVAPDGELYNIMRYQLGHCKPSFGLALVMKPVGIDEPLAFEKVIPFPGNHSKFEIHRDPVTGKYLSMVSYLCDEHPDGRNWLALIASDDLEHWEKVLDVWDYRDTPVKEIGFQYIDFFMEGEDILFLSRTAWNGAANFHDANYSVFTKIRNFRKYL